MSSGGSFTRFSSSHFSKSPRSVDAKSPFALSFAPPTRTGSHPIVLVNPGGGGGGGGGTRRSSNGSHTNAINNTNTKTSTIRTGDMIDKTTTATALNVTAPIPITKPTTTTTSTLSSPLPLSSYGSLQDVDDLDTTPMIQIEPYVQMKPMGGVFVRAEDADALGLVLMGEADTGYGPVQRYSPVVCMIFGRQNLIQDVFELPSAFGSTQYQYGIIGTDVLNSLGVSVLMDRGMVFLQDPELICNTLLLVTIGDEWSRWFDW
ncbi:hypothetical protein BC832DRAFT_537431 [Gaertneriomyces semiglobifer]|nr:hypothetical protein BC832DRAFT_537431 [Gaertneriomyces semiglobifer]